MNLIALLCNDAQLSLTLSHFRKTTLGVYLHPVTHPELGEVTRSLEPLGFSGALVLDEARQAHAFRAAQRSSLDAQEVGAADTLSVSFGGLLAEYTFGRAVGAALRNRGWDARGAKVVILGEGAPAKAACHELSSLGAAHLTILATDRPAAETTSQYAYASSTEISARAYRDPLAHTYLNQADLLIRLDDAADVPAHLLGPHLSVVDLSPQAMSPLRQSAVSAGALALGYRDVQAYQIASGLESILGTQVNPNDFLAGLHSL